MSRKTCNTKVNKCRTWWGLTHILISQIRLHTAWLTSLSDTDANWCLPSAHSKWAGECWWKTQHVLFIFSETPRGPVVTVANSSGGNWSWAWLNFLVTGVRVKLLLLLLPTRSVSCSKLLMSVMLITWDSTAAQPCQLLSCIHDRLDVNAASPGIKNWNSFKKPQTRVS